MFIKKFSLILLLIFSFHLQADLPSTIKDPAALIDDEIARLDTLIQATEQSFDGQKKLRLLIVEYQKNQKIYLKNSRDNDLLFKVIKSAHRVLQSIKENNLLHTFDPDFIDELTILSQPAAKRGIPKP
jgi:hypothetical protein